MDRSVSLTCNATSPNDVRVLNQNNAREHINRTNSVVYAKLFADLAQL